MLSMTGVGVYRAQEPPGVETAGALSELFYNLLPRDYHQLATEKARVIIVEMGKEVLAPFKDNLRAYAKAELAQHRVEVRLGEAVAAVGPTFVHLKSGEAITTHTLMWAAGVRANPLADRLGLPQGRGGCMTLHPDVRVSVAMQSGDHVGRQRVRRLHGEPKQSFTYWDTGCMATIGRGAAVVELPNKRTLHGPCASFAWLGVHLAFLSGMRNRIKTLWHGGWSACTHDRATRIIIDSQDEEVKNA